MMKRNISVDLMLRRFFLAGGGEGSKIDESAPDVLKKRYARGEISKEEYEEKKRDIS